MNPRSLSPRKQALRVLERFDRPHRGLLKANQLVDKTLSQIALTEGWSDAERRFFTELVYGTLRRWGVLETWIQHLSKFPVQKMTPQVRTLLRLGLYQLGFLDAVPDYAAVDSTLELAKSLKCSKKTLAFLNGMLRTYQREEAKGPLRQTPSLEENPVTYLQQSAGLPPWLSEALLKIYPLADLLTMAKALEKPAPLSLRVNTLKISVSDFHSRLAQADISIESTTLPECMVLTGFQGSPKNLPGYTEGWFTVQDVSAAEVAHWVSPQPGETVVDLCAAPGGKTSHLAALMQNQGTLWAVDPSPERVDRMQENLSRLGVSIAQTSLSSGEAFVLPSSNPLADGVLVDAPCSGLGTLRRHPEILLQQSPQQLAQYPALQLQLLEKAVSLAKPGGVIVYSTCSIHPSENQSVVAQCLKNHPELTLEKEQQTLIQPNADGFYIAKLRKKLR